MMGGRTVKDKRLELAEPIVMKICGAIKELERLGIQKVQFTLPYYIEWKVCKIMNLIQEKNPIREGYDAKDEHGKKYQIKYRTDDEDKSTGFGNIKFDKFDFLLCVFVNEENFKIESIYKVPHDTVRKHTKPYHSFRWNKKSKSDKTIGKIYPS